MTSKPSKLRLQRIAAGLRIADVVRETGLSATRISEIERGEGRPPESDELALIRPVLR